MLDDRRVRVAVAAHTGDAGDGSRGWGIAVEQLVDAWNATYAATGS